jgi:hypothetical protein
LVFIIGHNFSLSAILLDIFNVGTVGAGWPCGGDKYCEERRHRHIVDGARIWEEDGEREDERMSILL